MWKKQQLLEEKDIQMADWKVMVTGTLGNLPPCLGFLMEGSQWQLLFPVNRQCALTAFCVQTDAQERQDDGDSFAGKRAW